MSITWKRALFLIMIAAVVVCSDFFLKAYVNKNLAVRNWYFLTNKPAEIKIFENVAGVSFSVVHVTNKGVAWGMLSSWQKFLPFLRILIIIGIIVYLIFFNNPAKNQVSLLMIVTGASCNVLDYFLYGHVVDMFYFNIWGYSCPVFNVADTAIFLGIMGMILTPLCNRLRKYGH